MIMTVVSLAQTDYNRSVDKENGTVVLRGTFGFNELMQEPTFIWFSTGSEEYNPDNLFVETLKRNLGQYKIVVLLGTWCEDSQNLIPKLYTTLSKAGYDLNAVKMIGVDRAKEAKDGQEKPFHADKVPTIIVYKDEIEKGRIVEVVTRSIEADLADIISK